MSFVKNDCQQISFDDSTFHLTERERKMLEKSWAKDFSEQIFPLINEDRFSVLYSTKASRPNTPVNVSVGALILKELLDMTDDEIIESLVFDIRFQHTLHTTSFQEQPLSDKTLSRFRKRCYTYEAATGKDLIRETVTELSEEMARIMKINSKMKRVDSMMVASNIKRLSRIELLYTCISNLVIYLNKEKKVSLEGLEHYYDPDDYNRVIYHNRSEETGERIHILLGDADKLFKLCNGGYDDVSEYQLLVRMLGEQTVIDDDVRRLKTKEDVGMDSSILQNPADPDATYREKAGKQHRGYTANVVEAVRESGSIITDYQYEQNTYSDSQFLEDSLNRTEYQEERTVLVTDGGYNGMEHHHAAEEKNIELVTTDLLGREAKDIYADFVL